MGCPELAALDAEVALGTADARARAAALAHAERCPTCRRRLAALADVTAGLVELAPPAQPPAGFETRVLARVRTEAARGPAEAVGPRRAPPASGQRRRRRVAAAAAMAAGLALVAGTGGWWLGQSGGPATAPAARVARAARAAAAGTVTAPLTGDRGTGGQVVLVGGGDPWLSMTVHTRNARAVLRCQVVGPDGRPVTVGTFRAADGYAYWAAPVPPGSVVRAVRVVGARGVVLARASLPGTGW